MIIRTTTIANPIAPATRLVEDTELCRLISQKKDISEIGAELILKANKNGGLDNIAVVLVEIDNSEVGL